MVAKRIAKGTAERKLQIIAPPLPPQAVRQLENWPGPIEAELEITHCLVRGQDLSKVQRLQVEGCRLVNVQCTGALYKRLQLSDIVLDHCEAVGMRAPEGSCLRMICKDSRLTGADFGEGLLEDCFFENVKLDEAGLRFAKLKRVHFRNCILRNVDFSSAHLVNVVFSGCELEGATFDNVSCQRVDLRGERLSEIRGVLGLKGVTIDSEQLIQLAPLLATEVGLDVDYET